MSARRSIYYPSLDGLRAISVLLVIYVHVPKPIGSFLQHIPGWLGVDVFFVLSGFLITTLLLREEESTGAVDLWAFYVRRFFRIIPVYFLVLGVYVAASHFDPKKWLLMKQALPYYLFFMNDFVPERAPFAATWTLGIEEKFYLIWPVIFFVLLSQKRRREYAIILLYVVIAFFPFTMARSYYGLLNGCVLAVLLSMEWLPQLRAAIIKISPLPLVFLTLVGMAAVDYDGHFVFAFSLIIVLLVANLILRPSGTRDLLGSAPFIWLGKRSYAMYLVHGLVLDAIFRVMAPTSVIKQIAITIAATAMSAIVADGLLRWVEEPCRQYGKRVLARRQVARIAN